MFFQAALVFLFTTASIKGHEDTSAEFENLEKDIFEWQQLEYPNYFYENSMTRYSSYSIKRFEDNKKKIDEFYSKLKSIKTKDFSANGKLFYKMTEGMLRKKLDGYQWHLYGPLTPTMFLEPKPQPISCLFAVVGQHSTEKNIETIFKMIDSIPERLTEYKVLMQKAISYNRTLHKVSIVPVIEFMEDTLNKTEQKFINNSIKYIEFLAVSIENKIQLQKKGNETIAKAMTAYGEFLKFLKTEYLPSTRKDISINSWSDGLYQQYLKWHLDSNVTADDVHKLGLNEAERIKKRLKAIMDKQGFKGSIAEYMAFIRNDTQFYLKSADEIFDNYNEIISEIKSKLGDYFRNYPEMPLIVKAMAADGPAASYSIVNINGQTQGIFHLNVFRPTEMPTFEMRALALHEAIPGHHFQSSYIANSKHKSWWTKGSLTDYFMVPYQFPFYTAFVEGWGLYAEYLGEEMGAYKTDYEMVGRFSFELLRAYRLVIDTGIHAKQMTQQYAIDLLTNFTSLTEKQATIEVNRYITIPGQACAYKFGELKIRELRRKAERMLESKFDLKEFHATVLETGRVSLDILENVVDNMIRSKLAPKSLATTLRQTPSSLLITSLMLLYYYYY